MPHLKDIQPILLLKAQHIVMPSALNFSASVFRYPNALLPDNALKALEETRIDANVILPFAKRPQYGERSNSLLSPDNLWICISCGDTVEIVLACTKSELGDYPIFIVPTQPKSYWKHNSLKARLRCLSEELFASIPLQRVYSVFASSEVASLFTQLWSEHSGVAIMKEPYYAARLLSCTLSTSVITETPSPQPGIARPAEMADKEAVASLCMAFSAESPPFVLNKEQARKEAELLISKNQVWVYCLSTKGSQASEVACIVAFTRNTIQTATITKVYTATSWRRRGYCKQVVGAVCRYLLQTPGRREVVLYVAHDNRIAARVYEGVGFVEPDSVDESGHSLNWTEIGFDDKKVVLGHW